VTRKTARLPLSALSLLQREVNQLFERLSLLDRTDRPAAQGEWSPSVDVYESRGRLIVVAEVPGLAPDSLKVICRERDIVISGARGTRRPGAGQNYVCLERPSGRFERTISLEGAVDVREAKARFAGGLLIVTLPRLKERRGRETVIPIEWEQQG
jgi:HSP20 family protein